MTIITDLFSLILDLKNAPSRIEKDSNSTLIFRGVWVAVVHK